MIDELERVTQFRASQPPASELARQTAHARLMERIAEATQEAQRADHPLRHRCGRRWRYSRVTIAALGVGVVAALAVVVAIGSTAPSLAAAAALRRLAAVAALQSPVEPPATGSVHVRRLRAGQRGH